MAPVGALSMMLWDLSEGGPGFTGDARWTYLNALNNNLPQRYRCRRCTKSV